MKKLLCSLGIVLLTAPAFAQEAQPEAAVASPTVTLTWVDNSDKETGFAVKKRPKANPSGWIELSRTAANVTTYVDTVTYGDDICYTVFAFNSAGMSPPSNEVCVLIPQPETPPPAPGSLNVKVTVTVKME